MLMLFSLVLPLTSGLSSAACPSYSCATTNVTSVGTLCQSNTTSPTVITPCQNSSLYCDVTSPGQSGYCTVALNFTLSSYPGESCSNNSNCYSNNCTSGKCKGKVLGQTCATTLDCDVGFTCINNLCALQIAIGNTGCYSDEDCVNNAGCSFINSQGTGVCIQYYSLKKYTSIDRCYDNKNKICESGVCGLYNGINICLPELENSLSSPYLCSTTDYCYSEADTYSGIVLLGKCECSLDGNSYCTLFPGDPETFDYKNHRNAWVNTQAILQCHTMRRFSRVCMDQQWDNKKYAYWYYEDYVNFYQKVYNATACVTQVYYPAYQNSLNAFQNSAALALFFTLGILAF